MQRAGPVDQREHGVPDKVRNSGTSAIRGIVVHNSCECSRHLSELVLQLSAFEQYSDACLSRSPADALLHRHLSDAANRAGQMFEAPLAEVIEHEGYGWIEWYWLQCASPSAHRVFAIATASPLTFHARRRTWTVSPLGGRPLLDTNICQRLEYSRRAF